jgi:hypothetical protein
MPRWAAPHEPISLNTKSIARSDDGTTRDAFDNRESLVTSTKRFDLRVDPSR